MVFFSCNACNESLKKNQVEKHYLQKCRRCESLTCIDCGKEFWGDSYQTHTKCISEEEKYSGKDYVAKPNKGEVKQGQWIQKVQSAIQKAPANPQVKNLLQRLEDYPNVPRKKSKFENFLKSSLRVMNKGLMDQVWDLLMAEAQQQNGSSTNNKDSKAESASHPLNETAKQAEATETADADSKDSEKKLSKRERKEERKRKLHKAEKKDKRNMEDAAAEEEGGAQKKKGKRRKREEEEEEEEVVVKKKKKGKRKMTEEEEGEERMVENGEMENQPKKKKRKVETVELEEVPPNENGKGDHDENQDSVEMKEKKGKFDWGATIMAVLKSKGEISVKRLQKKVLAEYASYGSNKPEERVEAKFQKKLKQLPGVKLAKDKAILKQS